MKYHKMRTNTIIGIAEAKYQRMLGSFWSISTFMPKKDEIFFC